MFKLKIKILLLEIDTLDTQNAIEQLSANPFYETDIVSFISGNDLLTKLTEKEYDVIIFDFLLDFDVISIMNLLKTNKVEIPVIIVSQLGLKEIVIKALQLGAYACIKRSELNYTVLSQLILGSVEKKLLQAEDIAIEEAVVKKQKILQILYNLSQKTSYYYDNELLIVTLFKDLNQLLEVIELSFFSHFKDTSKLFMCVCKNLKNANDINIIKNRMINSFQNYCNITINEKEIVKSQVVDENISFKVKKANLRNNYFTFPVLIQGKIIGVLSITLNTKINCEDYNLLYHLYLEIMSKAEINILLKEQESYTQKLEKANKVKTDFLSKMTNELKNPLVKVIQTSNLLLQSGTRNLTIDQLEDLTEINKTAGELSETMTNIIELANLESGKLDLDITEFDIIELIENILISLRNTMVAKDLTIEIKKIKDSIFVSSDIRRLREILNLMITQTIDFALLSSTIIFDVDFLNKAKDELVISVIDPNTGIDENNMKMVFESYFEASDTYLKNFRGTEAKIKKSQLVSKILKGSLEFIQRKGEGSLFTLRLPVK